MIQLRTERLRIFPLSAAQLTLLTISRHALEQSAGLQLSTFELNADDSFLREFSEAITHYILPRVCENPHVYEWFTHWLIVSQAQNITIGGIGAAGPPDASGQVMIGYFIDRKFEGRGFASEAVKGFTGWLLAHPAVKSVIADTPVTNTGSQRVLRKNGFELIGPTEEGLRWQLKT
jgi:[ribosomal protein S5]-alanine N-acetyltransferase